MPRPRTFACLLLGLLVAAPLYAQPKTLGARVAALVAPLGANSALVIARIDTAKIDVQAGTDWVAKAMKLNAEDREQMEKSLEEPRTAWKGFREAGGQDVIWLVYPEPGAARGPIDAAAILTTAPGKAKSVAEFTRKMIPGGQFEITERGDTVVIASAERTRSLDAAAKPSPTVSKAFDAAGDGAVQAALLLSDDMRRVVRETLPRLPEEFGGTSGRELGDAFSWATLAFDAPPKLKLRLQVQATSADGAAVLARMMSNWPKIAGPLPEIREAIPGFDELVPLLTPKANGDKVVLSLGEKPGEIDRLLPVILAPLQAARGAATRSQALNNYKQVGLAMHNYLDVHKHFPAAAIRSKDGKALLSWRVAVLPYIDQNELYKQFRLDEPWDSEHNKKLIDKMPKIYEDPRVRTEKGQTTMVVPVNEKTIFGDKDGMKIDKISDGTSNTILAVESHPKFAVTWTKPDDVTIDPKDDPAERLFVDERKQILALFADGSVRMLPVPKLGNDLHFLFTAAGGEVINYQD
jgi:hypothetical protein